MKFPFSKKVITGLFAGAMALSIGVPASHAATPEKNTYHTINLTANPSLVWDVFKGWQSDDAGLILWNGDRGDNEQFVFFPLDGGAYAIVNKNSGKPIGMHHNNWAKYWSDGVRNFDVWNDQALQQKNWNGGSDEQWYLRDKGNNNFEIVNQSNGRVASWAGMSVTGGYLDYVDMDESNPSDNNRLFQISAARSTFSLPKLPALGTRPNAPEYNPTGRIDQQLPQTSESAVVAATLIPCIMVKDNSASDYTKIHNSPYYVLEKEEYWEKVSSEIVPAGGTSKYTVKRGVSTVDQQKMTDTLAMNFGADLGLKFGDQSLSLKYGISKTLQTEVSKTSTDATEEGKEKTYASKASTDTGLTVYQLVTRYTLKRTDGSAVSSSWSVRDNSQTLERTIAK